MRDSPRRGEVWLTDTGVDVLVISSTVYNEIPSEPTILVVPVFDTEPDVGFGVNLGGGWAARIGSPAFARPGCASFAGASTSRP